jgi:DNA modification methylase
VVLDPFVGSGTTVDVSLKLRRAGWGIDLNAEYLDEFAIPRVEDRECCLRESEIR